MPDNHDHLPNVGVVGSLIVWILVSLFGVSLTVLKRSIPMAQAAFYMALASFVGPSLCYLVFAIWPSGPWYVGIPICTICSLSIIGVALFFDNVSNKVGKADPFDFLPEKYRPKNQKGGDDAS